MTVRWLLEQWFATVYAVEDIQVLYMALFTRVDSLRRQQEGQLHL